LLQCDSVVFERTVWTVAHFIRLSASAIFHHTPEWRRRWRFCYRVHIYHC